MGLSPLLGARSLQMETLCAWSAERETAVRRARRTAAAVKTRGERERERERERDVDVLLFVDIHILHLFAVWFIAGRFCESLRPPLVLFFDRPFTTVDRR